MTKSDDLRKDTLELVMLKGLPASGKSTWAKDQIRKSTRPTIRINKDELRVMLHDGRWSKERETTIVGTRNWLATTALNNNQSVVIDDTNFAPVHEQQLYQIAIEANADFRIVTFDVGMEVCISRDESRLHSVGRAVIEDMYHKYVLTKPVYVVGQAYLPGVVICDLDGTIADPGDRNMYDETGLCKHDTPRRHVIQAVLGLVEASNAKLQFFTGRKATGANIVATTDWLQEEVIDEAGYWVKWDLKMRAEDDYRRDSLLKEYLYRTEVEGRYNVVAIFDDRNQVVKETWRPLGLGDKLFHVNASGRNF